MIKFRVSLQGTASFQLRIILSATKPVLQIALQFKSRFWEHLERPIYSN
jgi:hypothetical protein